MASGPASDRPIARSGAFARWHTGPCRGLAFRGVTGPPSAARFTSSGCDTGTMAEQHKRGGSGAGDASCAPAAPRSAPAEVGLTAGPGLRRTPGLRREELATLAGVSIDYYTRLERGKETRPSPAVLDALARALRLDDARARAPARAGRPGRPLRARAAARRPAARCART